MKNTVVLSTLMTAAILMMLSACSQSAIDKAEDEFVGGCRQGGAPSSACACVFDKMVDHYGKDRMLAIARSNWNNAPADFGQTMAHAAMQCR